MIIAGVGPSVDKHPWARLGYIACEEVRRMRDVVLYIAQTLDGFIAREDVALDLVGSAECDRGIVQLTYRVGPRTPA